jgi:hypothetical protein
MSRLNVNHNKSLRISQADRVGRDKMRRDSPNGVLLIMV